MSEVQKAIPGFNPSVAKANASAIQDQTKQLASITSALSAADNTFNLLITTAQKAGINQTTVGPLNGVLRALQQGLLSDSDVAQFNSTVATVKTEYAQVLARGGIVTDAVRSEASSVIDSNLQNGSLADLYSRLHQEGQIAIGARQDEINHLATGGNTGGSSNSAGGTSGVTPSGVSYTIH